MVKSVGCVSDIWLLRILSGCEESKIISLQRQCNGSRGFCGVTSIRGPEAGALSSTNSLVENPGWSRSRGLEERTGLPRARVSAPRDGRRGRILPRQRVRQTPTAHEHRRGHAHGLQHHALLLGRCPADNSLALPRLRRRPTTSRARIRRRIELGIINRDGQDLQDKSNFRFQTLSCPSCPSLLIFFS